MSRRIEIATQEGWVRPVLDAARSARPGDTIVVHSAMQEDFLKMELTETGKLGVKTINTGKRSATAYPFDVRDSGENAAKLVNWIQHQARAARRQI